MLRIPKIGVDNAVVQGVEVEDLRKGPGHYPETPMPGQLGNAAIAGHRTTYGQPFNRLDELSPGDEIDVTTLQGAYRYVVDTQQDSDGNRRGHIVVQPSQVEVLEPTPDPAHPGTELATLTLTTCNPKFSAAERLVVKATWKPATPASPVPVAPPARSVVAVGDLGLSGQRASVTPLVWWGLIVGRGRRPVVVAVPPLPPLDDVGRRRAAVPVRALLLLRQPRARAPDELLRPRHPGPQPVYDGPSRVDELGERGELVVGADGLGEDRVLVVGPRDAGHAVVRVAEEPAGVR